MLIDIPLISIFDNNTSRERKINFSPLFVHVKRTQRMRFVKPRLREPRTPEDSNCRARDYAS